MASIGRKTACHSAECLGGVGAAAKKVGARKTAKDRRGPREGAHCWVKVVVTPVDLSLPPAIPDERER